jgi:hypothetical protein
VSSKFGYRTVSAALLCITLAGSTGSASAITAELAKKCQALTTKAFPPRVPGNPAAGSAKGTGRDQINYYNKCVANDGKVEDQPSQNGQPLSGQQPAANPQPGSNPPQGSNLPQGTK